MRKKDILARLLDLFVPTSLMRKLGKVKTSDLIVLAYHRILDNDTSSFPFDSELISATSADFEQQVAFIKQHFNPISMEQLVDYYESAIPLPDYPVLITFDDGFEDNYSKALPILQKHNVPATIFISTGLMSTKDILWFDWLAALVKNCNESTIVIDSLHKSYSLTNNRSDRSSLLAQMLRDFKKLENTSRLATLEELKNRYAAVFNDLDTDLSAMLSWSQVKEMSQSLISFGSHTVTHPILSRLSRDNLRLELVESKQQIEHELGVECHSISYPDGNLDAYNPDVLQLTQTAGYKIGFSYLSGINDLTQADRFTLKRLHIEYYIDFSHFKALMCLPNLFKEH